MWFIDGIEYIPADDDYGFIYVIHNLDDGRRYIGRKYLTKAGYKMVKGKRKKIRKDSDWLIYYGSNEELKADVLRLGKERFKRIVLKVCKTRGECNYWEAKHIFDADAVLDSQYYNGWVSCKIHRSHVKNLLF